MDGNVFPEDSPVGHRAISSPESDILSMATSRLETVFFFINTMTANIRDIDVLRAFRVKLLRFAETLEGTLESMQTQTHRAFEWIEHDRPQYWTIEMRKAFDLVAATRTALNTCQMRTVAGHRSSCIEEKVAYDKAKRRLAHCQEQIDRVKRWSVKIHHEADEFRGRLVALRRLLDIEIPQALAFLEHSAEALEDYAEMTRPAPEDAPEE
jgi:hypothetical protein